MCVHVSIRFRRKPRSWFRFPKYTISQRQPPSSVAAPRGAGIDRGLGGRPGLPPRWRRRRLRCVRPGRACGRACRVRDGSAAVGAQRHRLFTSAAGTVASGGPQAAPVTARPCACTYPVLPTPPVQSRPLPLLGPGRTDLDRPAAAGVSGPPQQPPPLSPRSAPHSL